MPCAHPFLPLQADTARALQALATSLDPSSLSLPQLACVLQALAQVRATGAGAGGEQVDAMAGWLQRAAQHVAGMMGKGGSNGQQDKESVALTRQCAVALGSLGCHSAELGVVLRE